MSEDTNQINFNSSIPTRISNRKKTPRVFNTMAFLCTLVNTEEEERLHLLDDIEVHEVCVALDNANEKEVDDIYYNIFNITRTPIEFNEIDIENADIKELSNFINLETMKPIHFEDIPEHSKRKIIATHVLRRVKEKTGQKL